MTFTVDTDARLTTVDITDRLEAAVSDDLTSGTCTAFVKHTTAGLIVQENESRLREDLEGFFLTNSFRTRATHTTASTGTRILTFAPRSSARMQRFPCGTANSRSGPGSPCFCSSVMGRGRGRCR